MVREIRVPSSSSSNKADPYQQSYNPRRAQAPSSCHVPTVMGSILTPSSMCAEFGSSASLCSRTLLPQSVFTKVVRPRGAMSADGAQGVVAAAERTCARGTAHHQAELDSLLDILLSAGLEHLEWR
jgi:hypothetical protein